MRPYRSIVFSLFGISIAMFGLSMSMVGLAYTEVYSSNVNPGIIIGAVVALVGVIVALVSVISLKE